jgi:uncharacterized protein YjbI with pentapeptide repeats
MPISPGRLARAFLHLRQHGKDVKKMNKIRMKKCLLVAAMAAFTLAGCGGGSFSWPVPERQFGVIEVQLMDANRKPDGLVVGAGSGLVVTQIEPLHGPLAPLLGDSATGGDDAMWFDVDNPVRVAIDLRNDSFDVVSKVEVLNQADKVLLTIEGAHPKGELWLEHGRYLLRFTAAGTASKTALGMVWFGGESKLFNAADVQKLATGNCPSCKLRGALLSNLDLRGFNLPGVDLRQAVLLNIPGGLALNGNLFKVLLGASDVAGADLSSANLAGANLTGAYLTGAGGNAARFTSANLSGVTALNMLLPGVVMTATNLTGADFSGSVMPGARMRAANLTNAIMADVDLSGADLSDASLSGTDFTGAILDGATWTDGRICAAGSVGQCVQQ